MTTQLLGLGLRKMRQPKSYCGSLGRNCSWYAYAFEAFLDIQLICPGPTLFGRIPGFSEHIFPTDSVPYLSLVANIGLCLFLFLVRYKD